jgi:hypothetical protein
MSGEDTVALKWAARLFVAIGIGAAVACISSGVATFRFIAESRQTEGTVVDWNQGSGQTGASREPGAYYRVIEIVTPDGQKIRGETETGVGMAELEIGERVLVRYRPGDPSHVRDGSIVGLWLKELVLAVLAITFGVAGTFLLTQARKSGNGNG